MIHHIVLFKLSLEGEIKEQQILKIKEQLEALPAMIDVLKELRVNVNINPREEYDFMLLAILDKEEDIDTYANHPNHQAIVKELIKPHLEKRACVDILV